MLAYGVFVGLPGRLTRGSILIAAVLFGLAGVPRAEAADDPPSGRRIALLIANGTYPDANAPVPSAGQDAKLLADELRRADFDIDLKEDANKRDMQAAVDAFTAKVTPGMIALLYFNGFGIQVARQSYLIPVDAQIWSEAEVKRDGISLDAILAELNRRGARVKIVILDASRRNPYERRFRAFSAGLAGLDAPEGTLTLFSAAPGKMNPDPTGEASLFMSELAKELRTPDITAEEVFTHTRVGVSRASNGEQVPWVASSLVEDFFFGKKVGVPAPAPQPPPATPPPVAPPVQAPVAANGPKPVEAPPAVDPDTPPAAPAAPAPASGPVKVGDTIQDCTDCPELIVLAGGSFDMGAGTTPYDRPVHRVAIRSFAMAVNEVTFNNWQACVTGGGCTFKPDDLGWGAADRPVINISWLDAKNYVAWLSKQTGHPYRLPSEAEWEYAARGGASSAFSWGAAVGSGMANCRDCQAGKTRQTLPARSFQPNRFGLYDMAGNVAEWVEDCWNESYKGAPKDGSAWSTGDCAQRVLRGGSFDSTAAYVRPAARFRYDSDVRYYANGFRVARSLP